MRHTTSKLTIPVSFGSILCVTLLSLSTVDALPLNLLRRESTLTTRLLNWSKPLSPARCSTKSGLLRLGLGRNRCFHHRRPRVVFHTVMNILCQSTRLSRHLRCWQHTLRQRSYDPILLGHLTRSSMDTTKVLKTPGMSTRLVCM